MIAGRYELEELLGSGGMSCVFRARDRLLERHVALKVPHEQFARDRGWVERFRQEARALAQLSHPNIVTVIDRGEHDGRPFIVLEYVDGENLRGLLEREGPLPVRRVLELGLQVARALACAHEHGLVHRDVKPQNVLLTEDGRAKVTDFGSARPLGAEAATETQTALGTAAYVSPEQACGRRVDAQSDVYSLGAVLFELLTGEPPYAGDDFIVVALRHVHEPVPSVLERRPGCPSRLAAALERALAKDPAERLGSMGELAGELQACLVALGPEPDAKPTMVVSRPGPPALPEPGPERAPARHRPLLRLLALLTALAAAAAAALGALRFHGASSQRAPQAQAPPSASVELRGVRAYDPPPGDGQEHDEDAPKAADGDASTYWTTETYRSSFAALAKPGVGLVLDAGRPVRPARLFVTTDTPGFTARIEAGDRETGPFRSASAPQAVGPASAFVLELGRPARYYLVWITRLAGSAAHVNEVRAD